MQISTSTRGELLVVHVSGRLDATTAHIFDQACRAELDAEPKAVILCLAGVEYMSSAGLRSILAMQKNSKAIGCTLAFCEMQSMVNDLFRISGFTNILALYGTLDAAVEALSKH